MKEFLAEVGNFKIEGRIIIQVRFADDMTAIAKTQEELQDMVNIYIYIYVYISSPPYMPLIKSYSNSL